MGVLLLKLAFSLIQYWLPVLINLNDFPVLIVLMNFQCEGLVCHWWPASLHVVVTVKPASLFVHMAEKLMRGCSMVVVMRVEKRVNG